ncbi:MULTISPECIES: IclR family transcriptional regulator domain-containing protein [unclassified Sphingomonas]|uniref:IclR family transcriptional regulator domain-containing protein n=1 Tax=unclassified Sphingomonas TaxID=196159 RepID=UPI0008365FE6|nr:MULTISPECIES: IclR family transcriptional regulator C-terminal domain-containing protein [unclassified Sphingomonas]
MSAEGTPYREVRSLERGLALLDAMADLGWSTPSELARRTAIDRSTVYRLLATLVASGYAVRRPDDGRYFLAGKLGSIGLGIRSDDLALQIAQEELDGLVAEVGWPSDYAALVAGRLTILASTHRLTSMTFFRRLVGQHRPIARSALGRALLAAMSPRELDQALESVRASSGEDAAETEDRQALERMLERVRERGYGYSDGLIEANISAIALPVRRRSRAVGAVNIVYFRSALSTEAAASTLLPPLRACIAAIERRLDEQPDIP